MSCPSAPNFSIHSHQMRFSHLHVWDFVTCRPVSSRNSLHIMGYLDMFLNFCDSWLERSATKESHESTGQLRSVACKFHFFASNSSLTIAFFQPSASTSDSHLRSGYFTSRHQRERWIPLWIPSCLVSAPIFMSNKTMAFLQMLRQKTSGTKEERLWHIGQDIYLHPWSLA